MKAALSANDVQTGSESVNILGKQKGRIENESTKVKSLSPQDAQEGPVSTDSSCLGLYQAALGIIPSIIANGLVWVLENV
jgi:hypothetical protein